MSFDRDITVTIGGTAFSTDTLANIQIEMGASQHKKENIDRRSRPFQPAHDLVVIGRDIDQDHSQEHIGQKGRNPDDGGQGDAQKHRTDNDDKSI